jgi:hypothetical protein
VSAAGEERGASIAQAHPASVVQSFETPGAPAAQRSRWPWLALTFGAILAGVFLRAWQLREQMLVDDEWHTVRMLIRAGMSDIARHFGLADYCIPLTLYYRWLYEHAALSEWSMHLPLLLAGVTLLLVAPRLLRGVAPLPTRAIWTGLLALSPSLVYFSRTARPYALVALLGFVALLAFRAWRRGGGSKAAVVYALATILAGWAHLLSLVFTLWPFVHYGVRALRGLFDAQTRVPARRALAAMIALGLIVALPLAAALLPPLLNDWGAMAGKAGANSVTAESLYRTVLMQLGVGTLWPALPLAGLLVYGGVRLWRRDADFVALMFGAAVAGLTVICAARPAWIQHAPVLVRYAAPILPFLLLCVAEGVAGLLQRVQAPAAAATAALGVGALFAVGPMPGWYYAPNQFMGHALFQFDYDPAHNPFSTLLELGPVPAFYRELAARPPGSVTVIETPRRAQSNFMPDPWYQRIHRQNVKYALASPVCGTGDWDEYPYTAGGTRMRRVGRLADILDGASYGADYLIMHLQPWTLPPGKDFPWPVAWPDMPACVERVAARLGAPAYRDEQIVVFALPRKDAPRRH